MKFNYCNNNSKNVTICYNPVLYFFFFHFLSNHHNISSSSLIANFLLITSSFDYDQNENSKKSK